MNMSTKLHSEPVAATERTPLFASSLKGGDTTPSSSSPTTESSRRVSLFLFLEARTPAGLRYETFTIILILLSVTTFILGSLFLAEYNVGSSIAPSVILSVMPYFLVIILTTYSADWASVPHLLWKYSSWEYLQLIIYYDFSLLI